MLSGVKTFRFIFGSSGIWSDKVSLLHIKGTQRDRGVVYVLLIALVKSVLRNLANHSFVMK